MKRITLLLIFLIFATVNVSKWFLDVGTRDVSIRLGYHVPFLLILIGAGLIELSRGPIRVPKPIVALITWKALFIASAVLTLPALVTESRVGFGVFTKAIVSEILNAAAIAAMLLLAYRLRKDDRRRVLRLYLAAVALAGAFTVAQAVSTYAFNFDLDATVTDHLPLWGRDTPDTLDDAWGFTGVAGSRTLYRFDGVTGDANLNAALFLVALPVIFLVMRERFRLWLAALFAVSLLIIGQAASNTILPVTMGLLVLLTANELRYSRKTVVYVTACVAALVAYLVRFESEMVSEALSFKLSVDSLYGEGSILSHLRIASEALSLWLQHPLGLGPNAFAIYSADYSAHNSYLQVLTEYGPVGLIALLGTLVCLIRIGLRSRTPMGTTLVYATVATALAAIGHDVFRRMEFQLILHTLAAFALADAREAAIARSQAAAATMARTFVQPPPQPVVPDLVPGHVFQGR